MQRTATACFLGAHASSGKERAPMIERRPVWNLQGDQVEMLNKKKRVRWRLRRENNVTRERQSVSSAIQRRNEND